MADINDRLDRLQRREEFDRFGRPLRAAPAEDPAGPVVARPAGVDDRLGEVLDAVAGVVRRHPGLSVMIALADGRAGRPVIRVTERDGGVETGVVVVGSGPPVVSPAPSAQAAAVPSVPPAPVPPAEAAAEYGSAETLAGAGFGPATARAGSGPEDDRAGFGPGGHRGQAVPARDPVFEPAARAASVGRGPAYGPDGGSPPAAAPTRESVPGSDPVFEPALRDSLPSRDAVQTRPGVPANGRHAAAHDDEPSTGWSGSSWHNALWSPGSRDRFRPEEQDGPRAPERESTPGVPGPTIPIPEDTSQVVSRLAQLLRENPTLAASWSREAQE